MKKALLAAALTPIAAATVVAAPADAELRLGNYEVWSNRWTDASWVWAVYPCEDYDQYDTPTPDCVSIQAIPRPKFGAYYGGEAHLVDGRWSYTTDVPDGLRCPGHVMPTKDTYSWDAVTLAGTVESRFDVGCFNGPPGMNVWTFALVRL
ncbi:hypothetical protein [Mycolicibacterium bacteremicum]|uniref:Secreted protein n=2 Tax=Mycolicibacterium bacteremicum TaxID=564198 RepID=A0A1W9YYK5_MYCBA|nr:hypothetical protein [Mycolicibacterium bacteremicum]MCV7431391.1 hypothetical protein [Mycolicibacterium bacteremicum]ORA05158.1 hypothetical protein BST17_10865 [Mycolicibacterium bacteremicum]